MTETGVNLHHVGCLVPVIEEAVESYAALGYTVKGDPVAISSQKVRVCFLGANSPEFIELIEPAEDNGFLRRMLDKGINFYHLGFLCADLGTTLDSMTAQGSRILNRFSSEAFEGRECVFVLNSLGQMVELIQAATRVDSHAT